MSYRNYNAPPVKFFCKPKCKIRCEHCLSICIKIQNSFLKIVKMALILSFCILIDFLVVNIMGILQKIKKWRYLYPFIVGSYFPERDC